MSDEIDPIEAVIKDLYERIEELENIMKGEAKAREEYEEAFELSLSNQDKQIAELRVGLEAMEDHKSLIYGQLNELKEHVWSLDRLIAKEASGGEKTECCDDKHRKGEQTPTSDSKPPEPKSAYERYDDALDDLTKQWEQEEKGEQIKKLEVKGTEPREDGFEFVSEDNMRDY